MSKFLNSPKKVIIISWFFIILCSILGLASFINIFQVNILRVLFSLLLNSVSIFIWMKILLHNRKLKSLNGA